MEGHLLIRYTASKRDFGIYTVSISTVLRISYVFVQPATEPSIMEIG